MGATEVSVSASIRRNADLIVNGALEREFVRWPRLRESLSDTQLAHTRADTRYHLDFLGSALWAGEPILFTAYIDWTRVLFENLGLPDEWLLGTLECIRDAVSETIGDEMADVVSRYMQPALTGNYERDDYGTSLIDPASRYGGLAMRYLGAAIGGDRAGASQTILAAVDSGVPVADVYLQVLQPAQMELGRLWQVNRISVAQEHYATAVTQMVMSQLYEHIFGAKKTGHSMVAACVGGELHEVGMRMVADMFELHGWDTHYVGASTPAKDVVETVALMHAEVLALSATMSFQMPEVAKVIDAVRSDPRTKDTKILVGGYPFNLAPNLWRRVGADGSATDALGALDLAEHIVAA